MGMKITRQLKNWAVLLRLDQLKSATTIWLKMGRAKWSGCDLGKAATAVERRRAWGGLAGMRVKGWLNCCRQQDEIAEKKPAFD